MNLDISVETIERSSMHWDTTVDLIKKFAEKETAGTSLEENYTSRIHDHEWLCVSYYENAKEILGFSSVICRDIWNNSARLVNRMLKSRKYRFAASSGQMTKHTTELLKQQIEFCKNAGYDNAFMSRESNNSKAAFMRYIKNMGFAEWIIPEGRYRTCTADSAGCWQHVMYTPLKTNTQFQLEHITEDQYNEKFKTTNRLRGI